ncbi:acetyltransferase (GNAT) family protein [Kitasatospora sp. SolWspMP-SS2h]|uniref:GNAT family N-acetyltransferase n=1 Tax=Kitasatospora sp. SolWspMP-SS2h TaxID=1305729 RepID=UPI000DBA9F84|nr:GNAT family N-acetyltransferase [Kitasatospora sp. SolWspMP-SS2h]RAJ34587.1 acetyltransferase (GNAT) family protein [Kitasatospora sp. SolWspMP-SS2h]
MTPHQVRLLPPGELLDAAAQVRAVYAAAFGGPPWHEPAQRADAYLERLAQDALRPSFTAAAATSPDGRLLGFATAWTTPDPFPDDRCHPRVAAALGPDRTRGWLCGARVVDELAVRPGHTGRGIGAALLAAVTADAVDGRCWLLTTGAPGGPLDFYLHQGWHRADPGTDDPAVLLGPRHPARARP